MKKILCFTLAAAMIIFAAGCAKDTSAETSAKGKEEKKSKNEEAGFAYEKIETGKVDRSKFDGKLRVYYVEEEDKWCTIDSGMTLEEIYEEGYDIYFSEYHKDAVGLWELDEQIIRAGSREELDFYIGKKEDKENGVRDFDGFLINPTDEDILASEAVENNWFSISYGGYTEPRPENFLNIEDDDIALRAREEGVLKHLGNPSYLMVSEAMESGDNKAAGFQMVYEYDDAVLVFSFTDMPGYGTSSGVFYYYTPEAWEIENENGFYENIIE